MKLLYELEEPQKKALALGDGETVWYCVPTDLKFDNGKKCAETSYTKQTWIIVTPERFVVMVWERKKRPVLSVWHVRGLLTWKTLEIRMTIRKVKMTRIIQSAEK